MKTVDEMRAAIGPGADPQTFRDFVAENMMLAAERLHRATFAMTQRDDAGMASEFRCAWAHMQAARETFRDLHAAIHAT